MFKKTPNQDQSESAKNVCYGEGKYRALFMASRDAVMTLEGPSWKFTSGNPATIEMFKAKNEAEFLSFEPWKLSPEFQPDGRSSDKKAKEMIEKAMREGSNFFEWTHKRLNGENFFAEVLLSRVECDESAFLHALVRDITERKKIEEKLKEQEEEKFKIIFDSTNEGMLLVDIQTKKFYFGNNAICRMLGYGPEELKGLGITDIHPKESLPNVLEYFSKQMEGEIRIAENLPVKRKDGSVFYADISASKVMMNERMYGLGVFRDVTERKQMEEGLRNSEERFRKIFENNQYGIILTGADLKFIRANPAFCKITGYSEAELLTKKFSDITHPENVEADVVSVEKMISGKIPFYLTEKRYIKKTGEKVWVKLFVSVVRNEDGSFKYFLGMVEDISEQKKTEEDLDKKYQEIERMNKYMVDRELKMAELKKELERYKKEK